MISKIRLQVDKYTAEQVAGLMALAGFPVGRHWLAGVENGPDDAWFALMLGRKL